MFSEQIKNEVNTVAEKVSSAYGIVAGGNEKSYGYDTEIKLSVSEDVIGTDALKDVRLTLATNSDHEQSSCLASLGINGDNVIDAQFVSSENRVYVGIPKYTDKYLELTGGAETEDLVIPELPESTEIKDMLVRYNTTLLTTFQYKDSEKKVKVDEQGITFTATALNGECTVKDLRAAVDEVSADFKGSNLYKELNKAFGDNEEAKNLVDNPIVTEEEESSLLTSADKDEDILKLHMYIGKKGCKGYEVEKANGDKIGFITDGTSWAMYQTKDGNEKSVFSNKVEIKDKEVSGTIYLGEDKNNIVITYTDVKLDGKKVIGCSYKVSYTEEGTTSEIANGTIEKDGTTTKVVANINVDGKQVCTVEVKNTSREANDILVPENAFKSDEVEEWTATLDQEKMQNDLGEYMGLISMLSGKEVKNTEATDDVAANTDELIVSPDIASGETNDSLEGGEHDYLKEFSNYEVEDGTVYFQPSEEEVVKQDKPSTGIPLMSIDADTAKKVEEYLSNTDLAKKAKRSEDINYYVSGVEDFLESYYQRTVSYEVDYNNFIEIVYEDVTDRLSNVRIYCTDKDEAIKMTLDMYNIAAGDTKEEFDYDDGEGYLSLSNSDYTINASVFKGEDFEGNTYYSCSIY